MNPIEWLCAKAPGFEKLSDEERAAIMHFSLLWSFFEAEVLNTRASAAAIIAIVHEWANQGRLNVATFAESLNYYKVRHFKDGTATEHFRHLSLRENDNPALVEAVLKGENTNPTDGVSALFIVVYRLRNNLIHGPKWRYSIRDQLGNFTNANAALMTALETHGHL